MILFEKLSRSTQELLSLDLLFIFSPKKSTQSGNSQGLICLSNNSVSWAMYKERKQIMSTSLDSRFFRKNVLAWMKITTFSPGDYLKVIL